MSKLSVGVVNTLSSVELLQLKALLAQLIKKQKLTVAEIDSCIQDSHSYQFLARDGEKIVGVATLLRMVTPHGVVGYVHDVVVDSSRRGQGIGRLLMQEIESVAKTNEMRELNLTTSSRRKAAQKLYTGLGYELDDTGFYIKRLV